MNRQTIKINIILSRLDMSKTPQMFEKIRKRTTTINFDELA